MGKAKLVISNPATEIYHHTISKEFKITVIEQRHLMTGEITFTMSMEHFGARIENPIRLFTNVEKG